jgi:hypothetical protein
LSFFSLLHILFVCFVFVYHFCFELNTFCFNVVCEF